MRVAILLLNVVVSVKVVEAEATSVDVDVVANSEGVEIAKRVILLPPKIVSTRRWSPTG